jgi:CRP-like cAMP-binding protein
LIEHLIRKLEVRDRLSAEEKNALASTIERPSSVSRGEDLVREGDRPKDSTLLLAGFAGRYKILSNGKRQITAIHVPGDFIDLHSAVLKTMDHSIAALTPCRVAFAPHEGVRHITEKHPHLARLLWLNTVLDGAIHRQWLVTMGRQPARGAAAHLFVETFERLRSVGETDGNSFRFPVTQVELGDILGLSAVHVNRTIQELRSEGLITWRSDVLVIEDMEGLRAAGEFDPAYLNLVHEPR